MEQPKHSPLPWRYQAEEDGETFNQIRDANDTCVTQAYPYEQSAPGYDDMQFIIQAVNAHSGLVEALKDMLKEFNEQMPGIVHDELAVIAKARAALAAAGVK